MIRVQMKHSLVLALAIAIGLAVAWAGLWNRADRIDVADPPQDAPGGAPQVAENPASPAAPTPTTALRLEDLAERTPSGSAGDLFQARGWEEEAKPPNEPPPSATATAPQPPPLPFTYFGRWMEGRHVVVFLSRDAQNYTARVDDVLDRTYRVDTIHNDRLVMTYLPLGVQQTLMFAGASAQVGTDRSSTEAAQALLRVVAPSEIAVGQEFNMALSFDLGQTVSVERGSVELVYDPTVLRVSALMSAHVTQKGDAVPADRGRIVVEMAGGHIGHAGPSAVARFQVIAATPTSTQVRIAMVTAADDEDRNLTVGGPDAHRLNIVRAPPAKLPGDH
jgi:hypothetical protein